jgi:hypothetical protein
MPFLQENVSHEQDSVLSRLPFMLVREALEQSLAPQTCEGVFADF